MYVHTCKMYCAITREITVKSRAVKTICFMGDASGKIALHESNHFVGSSLSQTLTFYSTIFTFEMHGEIFSANK